MLDIESDVFISSNSTQQTRKKPSSYRILIVDDEQDIVLMYKSVLEEAGFNVDAFDDPLAALSKLKEIYTSFSEVLSVSAPKATKPYDLLLLDIRMPNMNGFELYREIKKLTKNESIAACFITAYEVYYEQLKEEFPKVDVGCFIKKPINACDLIKRIKQELLVE